jgi:hypothetical protein
MIVRDVEDSRDSLVKIMEPLTLHIPRPNPYCRVRYVTDVVVDCADILPSREKDAERLLEEHLTCATTDEGVNLHSIGSRVRLSTEHVSRREHGMNVQSVPQP